MERIVLHGNNRAADAATCGDLVAGLQLADHRLPAFLLSLLGQDQQEIHDADKKNHGHQQKSQAAALPACLEQQSTELALHHDSNLLSFYLSRVDLQPHTRLPLASEFQN